jgi:hypothetical protein
MHRNLCLLALATMLAIAGSTPAHGGEFSLFGSYWDTADLNHSGGVGVKFASGSGLLGFEARGGYYPDLNKDIKALLGDPSSPLPDLEVKAIPVELGLNLHFTRNASVDPFLSGGISYYFLDSNELDISDEFGYYLGGGVELGGGGTAFYAEALYRKLSGTIDDNNDPDFDRVDVDLGGLTLNAGVVWRY